MSKKSKANPWKAVAIVVLGLVIVFGMIGGGLNYFNAPVVGSVADDGRVSGTLVPCADPTRLVPEQYKRAVRVIVAFDGAVEPVPADLGVEPGCTRVIYTKDASGIFYIEPQDDRAYTLRDLFSVWGWAFSSKQLLGRTTDADDVIVMRVNGEADRSFEKLVLRDGQEIIIEYRTVTNAAPAPSSGGESEFTVEIPGLQ